MDKLIAGLIGAALGATVMYFLMRKKDEVEEEVITLSDIHKDKPVNNTEEEREILENCSLAKYREKVMATVSDISQNVFMIDAEEHGSDTEYDEIELTYYLDGVIVDDMDDPLTDKQLAQALGNIDVGAKFEELNTDLIFLKNDDLKAYYEVAKVPYEFHVLQLGGGGECIDVT